MGDGALADSTKIKHSNVTGKEALLDVLSTINTQFDDLLNASYHQDGQKLLATNRYLQKRFNSPAVNADSVIVNHSNREIEALEIPTDASDKSANTDAKDIKL